MNTNPGLKPMIMEMISSGISNKEIIEATGMCSRYINNLRRQMEAEEFWKKVEEAGEKEKPVKKQKEPCFRTPYNTGRGRTIISRY